MTNWWRPNLEDASSIPLIRWYIDWNEVDRCYIWLERGCIGNRLLINLVSNWRNASRILKNIIIARWMLSTFSRVSARKKLCLYLKPCREIGQNLKECLPGSKLVKNWMNNKTINEYGFRMIWRIMQISEAVIIILHIILSLIK